MIIIASILAFFIIGFVYKKVGFKEIKECYGMMTNKSYWTNYNTVEFFSWLAKAIIIVPGLIFHIQIWWLYGFTLCTSLTLIWASNKKLLPTLVGFNTLWAWISIMILTEHFAK